MGSQNPSGIWHFQVMLILSCLRMFSEITIVKSKNKYVVYFTYHVYNYLEHSDVNKGRQIKRHL